MFEAYAHYWDFQGRASRREYWLFALWIFLLGFFAGFIDAVLFHGRFGAGSLGIFVSFANLIPNLSVAVRRLHDIGRSGWWGLIILVPVIGALVLLVFSVLPGDRDENRFGPPSGQRLPDLQETFA